jgi:hypothetical protein
MECKHVNGAPSCSFSERFTFIRGELALAALIRRDDKALYLQAFAGKPTDLLQERENFSTQPLPKRLLDLPT